MEIETYEIEDASSEASAMANDAVAIELIESLGLAGQKTLLNKDTVTRVPYRALEATENLVYKALCNRSCKLEDYSVDPIPVRVLQVAAHARETGMFGRLEVWYPAEAKIDDPVLIGVRIVHPWANDTNENYRALTRETFYILARWGRTLMPFEQLEAMAVKMLKTKRQAAIAK